MIVSARRKKSIDVGVDVDSDKHSRRKPLERGRLGGSGGRRRRGEAEEDNPSFNVQCSDAIPFVAVVRGGMIKVLVLGVLSVVVAIVVSTSVPSGPERKWPKTQGCQGPAHVD